MKTALLLAILLGSMPARAGEAISNVETMQMQSRETVALDYPGATAAFAIDGAVAEATASNGRVIILARGAGSTTITMVSGSVITSFGLTVVAPPPWLAEGSRKASRSWTVWQGDYESSSAHLTNSLEMVDGTDRRTLRAYAVNVTELAHFDQKLDSRSTFPAISLEWRTERDEVVAFDKEIEHSPLTLDGTTVRGGHVRYRGFEAHAGVTSPLLYQNVFLPIGREVVVGASYELRTGRSFWTPSVYSYPSTPQSGGTEGTMGSLLYRYASRDDRLQLRSELGWGGVIGAAAELNYQDETQRLWFAARHEPRGFAALGVGRPLGSMADAVWTTEPTDRVSLNTAATVATYAVGDQDQEVATGTGELRYRLVRTLGASGGASVGRFRSDAMADPVRSITVPIGLHLEDKHYGASAIYRYQANSSRNRGGHGGRLSARADRGALHVSTFVDAQQEAPTLELILKEQPVLANLLDELGLTAITADDLARLLREDATLSQLGYVDGVKIDFNPWRAQAGFELAWLTRDRSHQALRLRALVDETRTVVDRRLTSTATLSYSRRFGPAVEALGMLSWWSREGVMSTRDDSWSIAAALRVRIEAVPRPRAWWRVRDVEGVVVNELDAAVAGVTVRLDDRRTATTDTAGHFEFTDVGGGDHRVEADLPPDTYFTHASSVLVEPGKPVRFTIGRATGRVVGWIRDDAGAGLAGIAFTIRGDTSSQGVATDSTGRFRVALRPGDYILEAVRDTLPSGYDRAALSSMSLHVEAGDPTPAEIVVPASRSISGTVRAPGEATIEIVELGLAGTVDGAGRYVFRSLRPGTYTVRATVAGKASERVVQVPAEPSSIRDVDFP